MNPKVLIAFVILVAGAAGFAETPGPVSDVEVVLYMREWKSNRNAPTAIVLELINRRADNVELADYVSVERDVALPEGARRAPTKERRAETQTKAARLVVRCVVPSGSQRRHIQEGNLPGVARVIILTPQQSFLLKVALPPEVFEVGTCALDARVYERDREIGRSKPAAIECIPAKP